MTLTPAQRKFRAYYAWQSCTVDGLPGRVVGRELDFALVRSDDGTRDIEFSWPAVHRVMRYGGGDFKS